jgi:hypothetical protein
MKWSIKNNTMFFYNVITVGLTLIVSLSIGTIVAQQSKHQLITNHIDMYSVFISHIFEGNSQTAYRCIKTAK